MQHRAPTQVRGRHRRTDTLPGAPVPTAPAPTAPVLAVPVSAAPFSDAAQAYLDLLASTAPLTPTVLPDAAEPAPRSRDAGTLLRDPAATGPTPRRRDVASHRAPSRPIAPALLGERGRYAVAAAAIAAGVGVAGVSAAATPGRAADTVAAPARTQVAAHTEPVPSTSPSAASSPTASPSPSTTATSTTYTAADGTPTAEPLAAVAEPVLGAVRAARKARPVPVPVPAKAPAAQWVDPMPGGVTTSCFGPRWGRLHAGVDLAAPHGTPIRAAGAGTVVSAGAAQGYGNAVLIDHGNGYLTHYGHMATITVTTGQKLTVGQNIGTEGSTGHSTGPHLHFEVHEGGYKNPIEPTAWMYEHGVKIGGCDRD